jgi:4'-phosphopantetheinyl transferase
MLHNLALKHLGPSQIFEVSKKPSGRPVVRLSDKTLMASISHSRNVVCVALACDEQIVVGIDVEFHEPNRNVVEILRSLEWPDVGLSDGEFYQEWCLYEARFKATGIVARNEQPEMCVSALDVPAQYTGILVWTAEC